MNRIYHIGISGGKDSTALLLWMINESGIPREEMIVTFCDTQNEAPETYAHIAMLSATVLAVLWLETEGFRASTVKHGFFPTKHRRFCTKELKLLPTKRFLEDLSEQYDEVVAVSGVRRDESEDRSKLPEWGSPMESYFGLKEWRPLIDWKIEDVLTIHAKYKTPLNPLYSKGARRVGCFPCVFSSKPELRAVVQHSPERIDYIREWEQALKNDRGDQTFFPSNKTPFRFRTGRYVRTDGQVVRVNTIDDVVAWVKTGYRAQGGAPDIDGLFQSQLAELGPRPCLAHYSACE